RRSTGRRPPATTVVSTEPAPSNNQEQSHADEGDGCRLGSRLRPPRQGRGSGHSDCDAPGLARGLAACHPRQLEMERQQDLAWIGGGAPEEAQVRRGGFLRQGKLSPGWGPRPTTTAG